MKKYWAVLSAYYDDGHIVANIVESKEADSRPQPGYRQTRRADLYTDWFDSREKAEDFVDECRAG